jgi:hypothetical protein
MIGVYIPSIPMTEEQYHRIDEKLMGATGGKPPEGLQLHTCFREGDGLAVFDVWESREAFEKMAPTLMPIVQEEGVAMPAPLFVEMIDYEVV